MVNALFHRWRDYRHDLQNKLFIRNYLYDYELEYVNSISAYYANDLPTGYYCCKKVIMNHKDSVKIEQSIKNLIFYKSLLQKDKKMVDHLHKTYPDLSKKLKL